MSRNEREFHDQQFEGMRNVAKGALNIATVQTEQVIALKERTARLEEALRLLRNNLRQTHFSDGTVDEEQVAYMERFADEALKPERNEACPPTISTQSSD